MTTIQSLMTAIDERTLAQRIAIPHDAEGCSQGSVQREEKCFGDVLTVHG